MYIKSSLDKNYGIIDNGYIEKYAVSKCNVLLDMP